MSVVSDKLCRNEAIAPADLSDEPLRTALNSKEGPGASGPRISEGEVQALFAPSVPEGIRRERIAQLDRIQAELEGCQGAPSLYGPRAMEFISQARVGLIPVQLPSEAAALGFQLATLDPKSFPDRPLSLAGSSVLRIPWESNMSFVAARQDSPTPGRFTRFEFDSATNTLRFETDGQERGTVSISIPGRQVVARFEDLRTGTAETHNGIYEPVEQAQRYLQDLLARQGYQTIPRLAYHPDSGSLVATTQTGDVYWTTPLRVPESLQVEVVNGTILRISDKRGFGFPIRGFTLSDERKFPVLLYHASLNPFALADRRPGMNPDLDRMELGKTHSSSSSTQDIQGNINYYYAELLEDEARAANPTTVTLGGQSLIARGPNREGEYLIGSGHSNLRIHPESGRVSPGFRWFGTLTIVSGSLAEGHFVLQENDPTNPQTPRRFEITLNFGNTDPDRAFIATAIEPRPAGVKP